MGYSVYTNVRVFVTINGSPNLLFAKSGVLMGCPLAVCLFVIAINLFLVEFQQLVVDKSYGVIYACADDLGGALLRITSLLILHKVVVTMSIVANLILQPRTCVAVLLVPPDSPLFSLYSQRL